MEDLEQKMGIGPAGREVLEGPYTVGGGGVLPPGPPPLDQSDHRGKKRKGKKSLGHFWYTHFWVPDPPPSSLLIASVPRFIAG